METSEQVRLAINHLKELASDDPESAHAYKELAELAETKLMGYALEDDAVLVADLEEEPDPLYSIQFNAMQFQNGETWQVSLSIDNPPVTIDISIVDGGVEIVRDNNNTYTDDGVGILFSPAVYGTATNDNVDVVVYNTATGVEVNRVNVVVLPEQQTETNEIGLTVVAGTPVNGDVELTYTLTDTYTGGDRLYNIGGSYSAQVAGEAEKEDAFLLRDVAIDDPLTVTVPADGRTIYSMAVGQDILTEPPAWRGISIATGQYKISNDVVLPDAPAETGDYTLVLPGTPVPYGSWTEQHWRDASAQAAGTFIYSYNHEFIRTTTNAGKPVIEIKMVPSSLGSERVTMERRLRSMKGIRVTERIRLLPGFSVGGSQIAAKISPGGFGMQAPSLGETPGGSVNATDGFSMRTMYQDPSPSDRNPQWNKYYYGADKVATYGSSGEYLRPHSNTPAVVIGQQYVIETEFILNTSLGASDGAIRWWIDGVLQPEHLNRQILSSGDINALWTALFTTYWGGESTEYSGANTSYVQYEPPVYEFID